MSYILFASSGGSGVQNPMTSNLNAASFDITAAGTSSANTFVAGVEISHTDPNGTIGFFGVPPTFQQNVAHPIVGANPVQNEDTINQICAALQQLGLIA